MEGIQDKLFQAIQSRQAQEAKRILREYPDLTNLKRTTECDGEVSTPLIEACRYGECILRPVVYPGDFSGHWELKMNFMAWESDSKQTDSKSGFS